MVFYCYLRFFYWYLWLSAVFYGYQVLSIGFCAYLRLPKVFDGYLRLHMVVYGYLVFSKVAQGYLRWSTLTYCYIRCYLRLHVFFYGYLWLATVVLRLPAVIAHSSYLENRPCVYDLEICPWNTTQRWENHMLRTFCAGALIFAKWLVGRMLRTMLRDNKWVRIMQVLYEIAAPHCLKCSKFHRAKTPFN